jgi:hypothetical protein
MFPRTVSRPGGFAPSASAAALSEMRGYGETSPTAFAHGKRNELRRVRRSLGAGGSRFAAEAGRTPHSSAKVAPAGRACSAPKPVMPVRNEYRILVSGRITG